MRRKGQERLLAKVLGPVSHSDSERTGQQHSREASVAPQVTLEFAARKSQQFERARAFLRAFQAHKSADSFFP